MDPPPDSGAAGGGDSAGGPGMPVTGKLGTLRFTRKDLNHLNLAEASTFGDYNKDGHVDVLSGPYWWQGPAFDKAHQLDQPTCTPA
ncbi:MAG TPA: hypothetical protein VNO55_30235, partial [Polyangia bacterium]|nr:hypothetical protein [Polyangia bacterium]